MGKRLEDLTDAELDALYRQEVSAAAPERRAEPQGFTGTTNLSDRNARRLGGGPREIPTLPREVELRPYQPGVPAPVESAALAPIGGVPRLPTNTDMAHFAYGAPYDQAKAKFDASERGEDMAQIERTLFGRTLTSAGDGGGIEGFKNQMFRNLGVNDELAAGAAWLDQAGRNAIRTAQGKNVQVPAKLAARAAADASNDAREEYASKRPLLNAGATALGIAVTGKPAVGFGASAALPTVPRLTTPAIRTGVESAAANVPFALGRQEGDLVDRLPGAAKETAAAFGFGAAGQALGNRLVRGGQRAAHTRVPSNARRLSNEGVSLTPGQMFGGLPKRIEDAATSLPMTGAGIVAARNRGVESFDRAALNRVLAPFGDELPQGVNVGRDGVRYVNDRVSQAYDAALAPVRVAPDQQFQQEIAGALRPGLPQSVQDDVRFILDDLQQRFSGPIDGRTWKQMDEELGAAIRAADTASASAPIRRYERDALRDAQTALRGALQRSDPVAFQAVGRADDAFSNLVRIREAAGGVGARNGVFSPAQLNNAVRRTGSKNEFGRGEALMQDLTDAGVAVLPSNVNDSGTALRTMMAGGAYGGAGGMFGADKALMAAGADATGMLLYSRPVQALFNGIYRAASPGQAQQALGQLEALAAQNPALVPYYQDAVAHVQGLAQRLNGQSPSE